MVRSPPPSAEDAEVVTPALFAEAVAAFTAVCRALLLWIAVGAATATAGLLGGIAAVAWVGRGVWRTVCRLLGARRGLRACLPASEPGSGPAPASAAEGRSEPHVPTWAQPDPYDCEEAA